MLKTNIWIAQHPNAGQNKQQLLVFFMMDCKVFATTSVYKSTSAHAFILNAARVS